MTLEEAQVIARLLERVDYEGASPSEFTDAFSEAFPQFLWVESDDVLSWSICVFDRSSPEFAAWRAEQNRKKRAERNRRRRRNKKIATLAQKAEADEASKELWLYLCELAGQRPRI